MEFNYKQILDEEVRLWPCHRRCWEAVRSLSLHLLHIQLTSLHLPCSCWSALWQGWCFPGSTPLSQFNRPDMLPIPKYCVQFRFQPRSKQCQTTETRFPSSQFLSSGSGQLIQESDAGLRYTVALGFCQWDHTNCRWIQLNNLNIQIRSELVMAIYVFKDLKLNRWMMNAFSHLTIKIVVQSYFRNWDYCLGSSFFTKRHWKRKLACL